MFAITCSENVCARPYIFEIFQDHFCESVVGCGSGSATAICSRPEVANDVIFGFDVDTFNDYD